MLNHKELIRDYIALHYEIEAVESNMAMPEKEPKSRRKSFLSMPKAYGNKHAELLPLDSFELDESFSDYLFRLIDEKGLKDSEVYKKANLDRKLFSKIRSGSYHIGKMSAIALALALELDKKEAEKLLSKAGYSLSNAILFDVIISYFLEQRVYDFFTINDILLEYDQKTF